jgi:hypothetical protein
MRSRLVLPTHGFRLTGVPNARPVEIALDIVSHQMDIGDLTRWL